MAWNWGRGRPQNSQTRTSALPSVEKFALIREIRVKIPPTDFFANCKVGRADYCILRRFRLKKASQMPVSWWHDVR
jgi:hypothetical protein